MAKAVISTLWKIEGTAEEIADLAAEIDRRFIEIFHLEMNYHGVGDQILEDVYLGTFITQGVK